MSHPKRLVNPALAAITLVLAGALPACSGETVDSDLPGVASVIDGDTIEIHGKRIRLNGIDAPESGQRCQNARGTAWRCGQQAALALSDRIGRRTQMRLFGLLHLLGQASLRMEQALWPEDYERLTREVEEALREANDPSAKLYTHEEVMQAMQERIDQARDKSR